MQRGLTIIDHAAGEDDLIMGQLGKIVVNQGVKLLFQFLLLLLKNKDN